MKELIITLIKIIFRILFSYGVVLLFVGHINPLEWRLLAKIIFTILIVLLLTQD
jgi:hypothetical protein